MNGARVVVAAVIVHGGRVLVSQRGPNSGQAGRWEFPGGKRERGESDEQALRRELMEELGIDLHVGDRIWTTSAGPLELRFYRCPWAAGLRPRAIGVVQFRWVRLADLATYAFPPADNDLVVQLASGRLIPVGQPPAPSTISAPSHGGVHGEGKAGTADEHPEHAD